MMAQRVRKRHCMLALSKSTADWDKVDKSSDYLTQFRIMNLAALGLSTLPPFC